MRILLIKPKHIGDTLILTPTITAIRRDYPGAEIWVVVRQGCEGILAGCPDIAQILTLPGVEKRDRETGDLWRQVKMILHLRSVKFDYVFELGDGHRARLVAILSRTNRRYSVKTSSPLNWLERRRFTTVSAFDWETCHRVEKDFRSVAEFLPLAPPIPPLCFACEASRGWPPAAESSRLCVMQIGKRQGLSRWDRTGWEEVGRHLLKRVDSIVIASGAAEYEVELAAWLRERLGPRVICTLGQADWSELAGLLYRAQLYVGLDTAAMHLAAACGCPIVALFGPSIEDHWHPWQAPYRIVTSHGYVPAKTVEERYADVKKRRMDNIEPNEVIAACDELLAEREVLQE